MLVNDLHWSDGFDAKQPGCPVLHHVPAAILCTRCCRRLIDLWQTAILADLVLTLPILQ